MGDYYYAFHQRYSAMTIGWSLDVEEKFYLLWPFVLTRIARPKLIKILFGILIAEPVSFISDFHWPPTLHVVRVRLPFGCNRPRLPHRIAGKRWLDAAGMDLTSIHADLCADSGVRAAERYCRICAGVVLVSTVARPTWFLNNPVSRYFGVISYSLCLCHAVAREMLWPVIVSRFPLHNAVAVFFVQFTLAISAASLLHYLVERPFLRLKDRLRKTAVRGMQAQRVVNAKV